MLKRLGSYDFDETAIIAVGDGEVGRVFHYVEEKYALHQRAYRIKIAKEGIIPKFIYHFTTSDFYSYIIYGCVSSTVKSMCIRMPTNYGIPIPPIEEQNKTKKVGILDKFIQLDSLLEKRAKSKRKAIYILS